MLTHFTASVDLGQKQDFSACVVLERPLWLGSWTYLSDHTPAEVPKLFRRWEALRWPEDAPEGQPDWIANVVHVQRWPIGTTYPQIVAEVAALMAEIQRAEEVKVKLIADATGVGAPVVDLFKAAGLWPVACTITGGVVVNVISRYEAHVPKRDLVFSAVALLESGRLRWPVNMPEVTIMERELRSFQMKYSKNGAELFEAERKEHDDLVLALAMATWLATSRYPLGAADWTLA